MTSMRRVVVHPGRISVEHVEVPTPAADEVLVRSVVSGICGSDTHAAHGRHPFVALPYHPRHEVVGVEALAADVTTLAVGNRVIAEPDLPCWNCKMCTTGTSAHGAGATYLPQDYADSITLLETGALNADDFVTATRPLEQVSEAFALSVSGHHLKVLVTLGDSV